MTQRPEDDVESRHRQTKGEARHAGDASPGAELPARDFEDDSGVTDLGVAEPRVPEAADERDDSG